MASFFETKKWKKVSHMIMSFGASIVLLGALFKINHYNFGIFNGETMLLVGLSIEALIFAIIAIEPLHKEYDWSIVFPELVGLDTNESKKRNVSQDGLSQLNELFAGANIAPGAMEKLGEGISRLGDTAEKLNDMSDAAIATNNYVQSMNSATSAIKGLTDNHNLNLESYRKMSELFNTSIEAMEANSGEYNKQMTTFNSNISSLNSMYEIQLKTTKDRLDNQDKMQQSMDDVMNNLSVSLENSKTFKEQTGELSQNLTALNRVYGNMLSAMNVTR